MERQVAQSNLKRLLNQTLFLLEQHKNSKNQCIAEFDSLLSLVKDDIKRREVQGNKEDIEKLECVLEIVHQQLDKFEEEVNDDIAFLEEQCMFINNILTKNDPLEAERMYVELMGDDELLEDKEFQKGVLEEAEASKISFSTVINDFKAIIKEGNVEELMAYLESAAEEESLEDDEVEEEDEDEHEEDGCCSTIMESSSDKECCKGAFDCKEACVCSSQCGCPPRR